VPIFYVFFLWFKLCELTEIFVQRMSPVHSGESRTWSSVVAESCLLPQLRQFQTSCHRCDIDQAAKYIGAGAATVGVAGSGL